MPTTRACLATTTTATRSTRPGQHSTIAKGITSVIISLFHICMVQLSDCTVLNASFVSLACVSWCSKMWYRQGFK